MMRRAARIDPLRLTRLLATTGAAALTFAIVLVRWRKPARSATPLPPLASGMAPAADDDRHTESATPSDLQHPEQIEAARRPVGRSMLVLLVVGSLAGVAVAGNLLVRGAQVYPRDANWHVPGGDAARGRAALIGYGCGGCHVIDNVPRAYGQVGPPLTGLGRQTFIAGRLPNTPENLSLWIRDPKVVDPQTAMPDLGVSNATARDIAAFLYNGQ